MLYIIFSLFLSLACTLSFASHTIEFLEKTFKADDEPQAEEQTIFTDHKSLLNLCAKTIALNCQDMRDWSKLPPELVELLRRNCWENAPCTKHFQNGGPITASYFSADGRKLYSVLPHHNNPSRCTIVKHDIYSGALEFEKEYLASYTTCESSEAIEVCTKGNHGLLSLCNDTFYPIEKKRGFLFSAAAFSHDGRLGCVGYNHGAIDVFDARTKNKLREIIIPDECTGLKFLTFSQDSTLLSCLTSSEGKNVIYIYKNFELARKLNFENGDFRRLRFSRDNSMLLLVTRHGLKKVVSVSGELLPTNTFSAFEISDATLPSCLLLDIVARRQLLSLPGLATLNAQEDTIIVRPSDEPSQVLIYENSYDVYVELKKREKISQNLENPALTYAEQFNSEDINFETLLPSVIGCNTTLNASEDIIIAYPDVHDTELALNNENPHDLSIKAEEEKTKVENFALAYRKQFKLDDSNFEKH